MVSPDSRFFASPLARAIALVLLTITVLFLRRPDQLLHPDISVEDGKYILPAFVKIDRRAHVLACAEAEEYAVPIHYIGRADKVWEVRLTGGQCRALLERSVL